ncbi:MAG TPA: 3'-5' exonuclease, partial [Burkholderiaceae bacterium]|nr:3'-5' exonuclease [Burkholderiaceae bacterium]
SGAGGGASGHRPPSVFIVGDPKQSIYRFRGAEPRVFAAARDFVAQALGGSVLECDHTRRNAPAVLETVNAVFEVAGEQGGFQGFRRHTTGAEDIEGSVVQSLPRIERRDREGDAAATPAGWRDSLTTPRREPEQTLRQDEAQQVARAVEALIGRDGIAPGEIFVLARRRALLGAAALALQARHIPYIAPEDNALMDAPEVRDLVAVLDALASPGHDLSLAQALRSPLFGASDEDLLWLSQRGGPRRWWRALQEHAAQASPALQRASQLLGRWAFAMQQLPPHDLLDRIVAEGELMPRLFACVPAPRRSAAVEAVRELLGLSLQLDGARYATVYGFVRALKRRALKMSAGVVPDAVQLLTVHGAKGLEARAVILMDCDAGAPRPETSTLLVEWPVDTDAPVRCAFVASESRGVPSLRPALERERAAREREELNGLYVAMTRARERLVVSAVTSFQSAAEASWWSRVVPHTVPWVPECASLMRDMPARIEYLDLPEGPLFEPAAPPMRPRTDAVDERAARVGQALHRVLEWATAAQPARSDLPALAQAAAAAFGLEPAMAPELQQLATQVLQSPAVHRFFNPEAHSWAGNEVTLADGADLVRLDRLVAFDSEDGRTWWVLDYKLQSRPQAVADYREQIERYRAVLQRLQPDDRVRAAFITAGGELIEA